MTSNASPTFDFRIAEWLEEGPDDAPAAVLETVLAATPSIPQRRDLVAPRRLLPMLRIAALAAALVVVVAGGILIAGGGRGPAPSPSPSRLVQRQSPAPSAPFSATAPPVAPIGYPGTGTIAFTRHNAAGGDDVWLINPDGTNETVLVPGGCCALFSPDGARLALAVPGVKPSGLTRDAALLGIEVLDRPGTNVAFIVPTGCGACSVLDLNYEPDAWSPNGRYIGLSMWSDSDPTQAGMGVADRDFAAFAWDWAKLRVTGAHADIPIAFSPDSSMLLFVRTEQTLGPTAIGPLFVLAVADLSVRQISPPGVTVSTNGLTQAPASWSPDGRTIAFAGFDSANGRTGIFAVGVPIDSAVRTLVVDAPGATSARFSPDGSSIAFDQQTITGFHDLYVIRPDGTGMTDLTFSFRPGVCCGQWAPDSSALVAAGTESDDSHNDLFVVLPGGRGVWQVTNSPNVYSGFLWGAGFR
jgi:TolB protein